MSDVKAAADSADTETMDAIRRSAPARPYRILVVEDSAVAVAAIREALRDEAHELEFAPDGELALAAIESGSFDLVITDWLMPKLDGCGLCRAIRADPELAGLYVVFLTVQDATAQIVEGLSAGADDYLVKPFRPEELRARVRAGLRIVSLQREREELHAEHVRRLEELSRLRDEFVSLVSHELRTPLTSVKGYLELLSESLDSDLNADQQRFFEIIERNSERILRLVDDLLFGARIESGQIPLELEPVDLAALAAEAVDAARPRAEELGIALRLDVDPTTVVPADRTRLAQVLDNLVSNGIKFTAPGGSVDVRVRPDGARALIEVADSGMGIPAGDRERLFSRFFRGAHAVEQAVPGTGLGLSITKAIVSAHGGEISVESEEGSGSTFRVHLPLETPAGTAALGEEPLSGRGRRA